MSGKELWQNSWTVRFGSTGVPLKENRMASGRKWQKIWSQTTLRHVFWIFDDSKWRK
jgi:hypothetical protein